MRQQLAIVVPTALVAGCSLIYSPSNLSKATSDASPGDDVMMTADARIDAPPLADANPAMLTVEDVAPKKIYEGQGQGGSRPALLVIRGHHFVPDGLAVTIEPNAGLTLGTPMVSNNGDFIALPVTVDITATASGTTALTITVDQMGGPPGGVQLAGKLELQHLPEFPAGTTIAVSSLATLYSQVDTASNVTFTGTSSQPAIVRAVSSIEVGNINVAGAAGTTGANAGAGGPGGCIGGGSGAAGGCSQNDGGGGGAANNGGGGGGGFAAPGGQGSGGGTAGVKHGTDQLVSYTGAAGMANQGAGGGGGSAGTLGNAGAGGGGGGTIELTAGGNITVGAINANGGKGGDASALLANGGGGGGGSGGVVVLRSAAGTITAGAITAEGGAGGAKVGSGGAGGMGGPGRVRFDHATATGSVSATPAARRGVSFAATTQTIVTTDNPMLTFFGTSDDIVDAYVIDADGNPHFGEPMNLKFVNGALTSTVTLLPGYNNFCVTLRPGTRGDSLADTCLELAYLP